MASSKTVLVTAASGNVGGIAVKKLIAAGWTVRAGVRNVSGSKAVKLAEANPGVQLVVADTAQPESVGPALQGIDAILIIPPGSENRGDIGAAWINAAKDANVPYQVIISVPGADADEPAILFGRQFSVIEKAVVASGITNFTVLRLPQFMENFFGNIGGLQQANSVFAPVKGDSKWSAVSLQDAGDAVVNVLKDQATWAGKKFIFCSPPVSYDELVATLNTATGNSYTFVQNTPEQTAEALKSVFAPWQITGFLELLALTDLGYLSSPDAVPQTEQLLGRPPTTYQDFLTNVIAPILKSSS